MAPDDLRALIVERIRLQGPMTFAAFMDLALYHPELGYYARAARKSGRAGDFFTSVDVGSQFGQLLVVQLHEMWRLLGRPTTFDLVEAGASSGRLARDILDSAARLDPAFYDAIHLTLVERSPAARMAQPETLGPHAAKIEILAALPERISGVLLANELLDALPFHVLVMTRDGLQELVIDANVDRLIERLGPLSSQDLTNYLEGVGAKLERDWQAEVSLESVVWTRQAAEAIERGFLLIIDYGHDASDLFSAAHVGGTRASFRRHVHVQPEGGLRAPWLDTPGDCDITAHIDVTSVARAAVDAGMVELGSLDQTYFLLGLGLPDLLEDSADAPHSAARLRHRLALKTLVLPGGLGSTHKVLIFGKAVGRPALLGCSYAMRLT